MVECGWIMDIQVDCKYECSFIWRVLLKKCVFCLRTNVQRIISGPVSSGLKGPESVLHVKYTSFPVNYETDLKILDTDYDNFAVMYSCSRIGPIGLFIEIFFK